MRADLAAARLPSAFVSALLLGAGLVAHLFLCFVLAGQAQLTLFWQVLLPAAPEELRRDDQGSEGSGRQPSVGQAGLVSDGDAAHLEALLQEEQQQQQEQPAASADRSGPASEQGASAAEAADEDAAVQQEDDFAEWLGLDDDDGDEDDGEGSDHGLEVSTLGHSAGALPCCSARCVIGSQQYAGVNSHGAGRRCQTGGGNKHSTGLTRR